MRTHDQDPMPAVLYRRGRVYSAAAPRATAMLTRDGTVAWLGADIDAPPADHVVDLGGALVAPAFVDAHVHATDTGVTLLGLDLSGTRSAAEVLDRLAAHAAGLPADAAVVGHGWDESTWPDRTPPTAAELDRAGGGRRVYLSQVSVHSAIVSSSLLAAVAPDAPGRGASGWLRRDAHHTARALAMGAMSDTQRGPAQRAALRRAASLGIAAVHECGGPDISSEADFLSALTLGRDPGMPDVFGYWGELGGVERARDLGAVGAGGDLFADGALGSQTAHLREAYLDAAAAEAGPDRCGHGYLSADQIGRHLVACTEAGVQGGFHAIGDAAIAAVLDGFAIAAAALGVDRVRAAGHRVEHAEILDRALIAGFVEHGVTASVQPAFDRLWGGAGQMYEQRLGLERALASNPIGALAGVGVALAFGSDSPVTPLDPWGTIRAAMAHHNPAHRVGARTAFAAHTRGGWRAAGVGGSGVLAPGADATFAVWRVPAALERGLPVLLAATSDEPDPAAPVCLRTVAHGRDIFNVEEQ